MVVNVKEPPELKSSIDDLRYVLHFDVAPFILACPQNMIVIKSLFNRPLMS